MQQDPMGYAAGDNNLYQANGNEPTSNTDPTGLWPRWVDRLERWMDRNVGDPLGALYNQSGFFRGGVNAADNLAHRGADIPFIVSDAAKVTAGFASEGLNVATGGRIGVYEPTLNSNYSQLLQQARQNGNETQFWFSYAGSYTPAGLFIWAFNVGQQGATAAQIWQRTGDATPFWEFLGGFTFDVGTMAATWKLLRQPGDDVALSW